MPTLHIVWDPNDKITPCRPDDLKKLGISVAIMAINTEEIETETIQETSENLTALLLSAIARDQQ